MKDFIVTDPNDGSCYCSKCLNYFASSVDHLVYVHDIDPLNLKKKPVWIIFFILYLNFPFSRLFLWYNLLSDSKIIHRQRQIRLQIVDQSTPLETIGVLRKERSSILHQIRNECGLESRARITSQVEKIEKSKVNPSKCLRLSKFACAQNLNDFMSKTILDPQ